jgi:hypothetical protein
VWRFVGLVTCGDKRSCARGFLYILATEKEKGGIESIPILDSCIAASLTCVHHKCVRVTSEFARLFAELSCSFVRCYPDTDQSARNNAYQNMKILTAIDIDTDIFEKGIDIDIDLILILSI